MDLRLKFNEDVVNYDKWRPTYVAELFNDIIHYSGLNSTKNALEIGIGTGQATLPILKTGCKVTAVELGEKLAEFTKQKFSQFSNFKVINIDFESFTTDDNKYDMIYSATAFHWLPQDIGFTKVHSLLKHGGTVALFWNHPIAIGKDATMHIEIQKIYKKYKPFGDKSPKEFDEKTCQQYADTMGKYGFSNVITKIYRQTRKLHAEDYISLLNTYSDHRSLQMEVKNVLESEIATVIDKFGGIINIYDTMDLYLGKKYLVE
ncbi:methyltransferase domain-containing protein [Paenibacillus sp. 7124]|uniref:Methyltransferase domain-containing protein n=1 Tax=Paenibacillus apii TaxID=1850370 RepID=A0A6M1PK53_9BACL|nr:methyltransferase domain-containing protein [Paenibacillus apii]NGM83789.1 methyltransferase domain-containing protein [Paenibacillus apii]